MKEIELKEKRKLKEKHFLREDGTIVAKVFNENVHYFKDGKYEDIDNSLNETSDEFINKENSFKSRFKKNIDDGLLKVEKDEFYIDFNLSKKNKIKKKKINVNKNKHIIYTDLFNSISFEYQLFNSKIKESIILKDNKYNIEDLIFDIDTNLKLEIKDDNIYCLKDEKIIFIIDKPFMVDKCGVRCDDIKYILFENNNKYQLIFDVDEEWLNSTDRVFPIIIDPTITEFSNDNSVQDTYISSALSNYNMNLKDFLNVGNFWDGTEEDIYRTLLKFTLPEISTASQIIDAKISLVGYPLSSILSCNEILEVHKITEDWDESTATWESIYNKYDDRIEAVFESSRSSLYYTDDGEEVIASENIFNITNLVKEWYIDTPNYGVMIKSCDETKKLDIFPKFFSKDNVVTSGDNPKPVLSITYRNQNGYENYLNYISQKIGFHSSHINTYNGNLCLNLLISESSVCKLPFNLSLFYNTNDVLLEKDFGFTKGFKLNFNQTIIERVIDNICYLEYMDEDGTIHYFKDSREYYNEIGEILYEQEENTYYDEDNMNYKIVKYNEYYLLSDENDTVMKFIIENSIGKLVELINNNNYKISVYYDELNRINKIIDTNENEISIVYNETNIIVSGPLRTTTLNLLDNKISSIDELMGSTLISYNENNFVSSISGTNGKKISFEYYGKNPYKIKKVLEYGIDNVLGNSLLFEYGFNITTLTDNRNKITSLLFNDSGSVESIVGYKDKNILKDSYGIKNKFGELYQDKYKLLSMGTPVKYIKNYLSNTSFETDNINFIADVGTLISISNDCSYAGYNSLKIDNLVNNNKIRYSINVPKGFEYTFSTYLIGNANSKIRLSYLDNNGQLIETLSDLIYVSNEFNRYNVTINYDITANSPLYIDILLEDVGVFYVDNIQLEEGNVVSHYNYLENSDFQSDLDDWVFSDDESFSVVNISDEVKALKINMNPLIETYFYKTFNVKGKPGDKYRLSFWYKNEGVNLQNDSYEEYNTAMINFDYVLGEDEYGIGIEPIVLNPNKNEWQFFSISFTALNFEYISLTLSFAQLMDANTLYITNICLYKEDGTVNYKYDEYGNILSIVNYDDKKKQYLYMSKDVSKISYEGNFINYEYENGNLIKCIDALGVNNNLYYDSNNNLIKSIITRKTNLNIEDGIYNIRKYNSNEYLNFINDDILFSNQKINTSWYFEFDSTIDGIDYYKIRHFILDNCYLTINEEYIDILAFNGDASLFCFDKSDYEGVLIKNKQVGKYVKLNDNMLILDDYLNDDASFVFFLEVPQNSLFLENTQEFTDDGLNLKKAIDEVFSDVDYDYNSNGLVKSITKDTSEIEYFYNEKNQLIGFDNNGRKVNYEYNNYNKLSKIISANKVYEIIYDDFFKVKSISLNGSKLIEYTYESNNGNLISVTINNDKIDYEYDEFDRLISKIKNNKKIEYFYNDVGDLAKILGDYDKIEYIYNFNGRIIEYKCDDLVVKNVYDSNDNIVEKKYYVNNELQNVIKYNLNENNYVSSVEVDNNIIDLTYDQINRIINKKLNYCYDIQYDYLDNGYRASYLTNLITYNGNAYFYNYDNLFNLKSLFKNNDLVVKYKYDIYNQLIEITDYKNNILEKNNYDSRGNLNSVIKYNLDNYSFISKDIYKYNDSIFVDKLTQFNDKIIEYNSIGNPIAIGDDISIEWINGNELASYVKDGIKTTYEYNDLGNRISKTCGVDSSIYYYEEGYLSVENRNGIMIYYLRYADGGLFGFKINNSVYFYNKNFFGDIIGILDSNGDVICNYEYDGWGKVISIVDQNGSEIIDKTHPAIINPFRYREYYYDDESGLYNIYKRYYSPEMRRFINKDSQISDDFIGNNLYVYCGNNPVNSIDVYGNWTRFVAGAFFGAVSSVCTTLISAKINNEKVTIGDVVFSAVKGAVFGAISPKSAVANVLCIVADNLLDSTYNEIKHHNSNSSSKRTIEQSVLNVITNTTSNTIIDFTVGKFVDKKVGPIVGRTPKKFITALTGKRALKIYKKGSLELLGEPVKETSTKLLESIYNDSVYSVSCDKQNEIIKIEEPNIIGNQNTGIIPSRIPMSN